MCVAIMSADLCYKHNLIVYCKMKYASTVLELRTAHRLLIGTWPLVPSSPLLPDIKHFVAYNIYDTGM